MQHLGALPKTFSNLESAAAVESISVRHSPYKASKSADGYLIISSTINSVFASPSNEISNDHEAVPRPQFHLLKPALLAASQPTKL
jgi:hypothetical protein